MADHAQLLRAPEAAPRAGRRAGRGDAAASASPATAQLAAHDELAQRVPAVREAAQMGELLAARPVAPPPAQRVPEPDETGLGEELKSGLETLSGRDLSPVRVHYDSPKPAQLNAKAYTQLPHIYVAPGEEENVPHEGWHAAQQMAGGVSPTLDVAGTPVNDDPRLEREADVMGQRALTVQRKAGSGLRSGAVSEAPVAQRVIRLADDADKRLAFALASLVGEPVLTAVEKSPLVVLISSSAGRQSESWRKTPRNRNDFEARAGDHTATPGTVDFLVTINDRELGGLRLDPVRSQDPRSFEPPRRTSSSSSGGDLNRLVAEALTTSSQISRGPRFEIPLDLQIEFLLRQITETLSSSQEQRSVPQVLPELSFLAREESSFRPSSVLLPDLQGPRFEDIPPPKTGLSLATVLLHELGHVRRELQVEPEVLRGDVDLQLQAPDASLFVDPRIAEAVRAGTLDTPIWQAVRNRLNALNGWIHQAKGALADAPVHLDPAPPSQEAATKIEELIARAQLEVGLWLEYDVISNVEHPFAVSQNEPIRRYHGEEAPLEGNEDDLPPLVDLEEMLRPAPKNLGEVHERMASEAQRLAGGLPFTLETIWAGYQVYRPKALASLAVLLA
jgi:hypothetical protein